MIVAREKPQYQNPPRQTVSRVRRRPLPGTLSRSSRVALTASIVLLFGLGIMILLFYVQMLATGFQIVRMQKEVAELEVESRGLAEEVSRLSSLERVEAVATTRLNMVKPDDRQVVLVRAETVPGSEAPAPQAPTAEHPAPAERHWMLQALVDLVNHRGQGHHG
ncbi:MAG: cell division protein FtsL [Thermoanaerobacteraceae bacterium]|nr:cell division protein FtsL [Thermoanaerobacteraceae bacterium]